MSTWRIVRGQLSGLGMPGASLPQGLVAYFRLVPRVLVSTASRGWGGRVKPGRNFVFLPPLRGKEKAFGKSPSLYRNGRSRVGEADPAMRENHPGFRSYLCGLLPFGAPRLGVYGLAWPLRGRTRAQGRGDVGEDVRDLAAHRAQDDEHDHEDQDQDQGERADREADREPDAAASRTRCGAAGCRHPRLAVPPPQAVLRIGGSPAGAVPPPETVR